MVIVGKYTIHAIQIDPVGLIQVPKVTAVTAASACRVFCRFLTATADEQLREDSTKELFFLVFYVVCVRVTPAVTIEEREDDVMFWLSIPFVNP